MGGGGVAEAYTYGVALEPMQLTAYSTINIRQIHISLTVKCLITFSFPGPGCSKLTTSLVNVSLKFQMLISQIH